MCMVDPNRKQFEFTRQSPTKKNTSKTAKQPLKLHNLSVPISCFSALHLQNFRVRHSRLCRRSGTTVAAQPRTQFQEEEEVDVELNGVWTSTLLSFCPFEALTCALQSAMRRILSQIENLVFFGIITNARQILRIFAC